MINISECIIPYQTNSNQFLCLLHNYMMLFNPRKIVFISRDFLCYKKSFDEKAIVTKNRSRLCRVEHKDQRVKEK